MKRFFRCFLALFLVLILLTGCVGGINSLDMLGGGLVLVCEKADKDSFTETENNVFQSLHNWSCGYATTDEIPSQTVETAYYLIQYKSSENVIDEYVDMLIENGFTLLEKDDDPYLAACAWRLRCDTAKDAYPLAGYGDDCHISIEGYSSGKFFVKYSGDLKMYDLGLRKDGKNVDVYQMGESATAGLYRLPDGSYETTDGRLKAKAGTATVIRDGEKNDAKAHYFLNKSEWLMVNEYHRNEDFFFAVDPEYTVQGDFYLINNFTKVVNKYYFSDGDADRVVNNGHGDNPFFLMATDGSRYGPTPYTGNRFESVFIRVMYYEEDVEAVYYVYAKLNDSEPSELEALCAISLKSETEDDETEKSSGSTGTTKKECSACFGDGKCNMCGGSGTKRKWTGDSYITQDCTGAFCNNGRCNQCGGDGER